MLTVSLMGQIYSPISTPPLFHSGHPGESGQPPAPGAALQRVRAGAEEARPRRRAGGAGQLTAGVHQQPPSWWCGEQPWAPAGTQQPVAVRLHSHPYVCQWQ